MIEQRTPEWYAARVGHATASRAEDILATIKSGEAASRKNYRADVVVERLTGLPADADGYVSKPMQWGIEQEPFARAWYCDKKDVLVTQLGFEKHKTIPWVGCSVDSEVEDGKGGLEIKCPNTAQHIAWMLDTKLPAKHIPQVQFQMWVMGWEWVDFVTYDPRMPDGLRGAIFRVARDQKYIDALEIEVKKFLAEVDATVAQLRELAKKG